MKKIIIFTLGCIASSLIYAAPYVCPSISALEQVKLDSNNHDFTNTWNFYGKTDDWVVVVGRIKAMNLKSATFTAYNALAQVNIVSGPMQTQQHWVCKYLPEQVNGYYVLAWNVNQIVSRPRFPHAIPRKHANTKMQTLSAPQPTTGFNYLQ